MPQMGFEATVLVLERAKIHVSDLAATVISKGFLLALEIRTEMLMQLK
jgi:hypothetical protein